MPRFFFHVQSGGLYPDDHGTELPDEVGARSIALEILSQLVRDTAGDLWREREVRVYAEDERRARLFTIEVRLDPAVPGPFCSIPN